MTYSESKNHIKMSFAGAVTKVKNERCKSIWDIDYGSMSERIGARRERIR